MSNMPERICLSRVSGSQLSLSIVGRVWSAAGRILGTQLPSPQHREGRNPARTLLMTPFPRVTSPDSVRFHQLCSSGAPPPLEDLLSQTFELNPWVSAQLLQMCPTLPNLMDCSSPGCSIHGILQARILEWVAMPSSRESSQPGDRTRLCLGLLHCSQILYALSHLGSPAKSLWAHKTRGLLSWPTCSHLVPWQEEKTQRKPPPLFPRVQYCSPHPRDGKTWLDDFADTKIRRRILLEHSHSLKSPRMVWRSSRRWGPCDVQKQWNKATPPLHPAAGLHPWTVWSDP